MAPLLYAGFDGVNQFCHDVYGINEPLFCIWVDIDVAKEVKPISNQEFSIDYVHFYPKAAIVSLFFPNGFVKEQWNLVLATINDTCKEVYQPPTGVLRGWIMAAETYDLHLLADL